MNTRTVTTTIVALSALLIVSGVAEAQPGRGGPGQRGRHGRGMGLGPRIAQQLELTGEQRAAVQAIRAEARAALEPVQEDLRELRGELHALWSAPQPSAEAILAKHAQMDELRSIVRDQRMETKQAVQAILTPEQQAELAELRGQGRGRGQWGRHGRGGRGGRGGGPGMGGRGMGFGPRIAQQLELTADQQSAIAELRSQAREATAEARSELHVTRQAIRAQMQSGTPDMTAVNGLHAQADGARQVVRENMVHTRIAILGLLSAEQRAELQQLMAQRPGRRGMGGGHGMGPGARRGMGRGGPGAGFGN